MISSYNVLDQQLWFRKCCRSLSFSHIRNNRVLQCSHLKATSAFKILTHTIQAVHSHFWSSLFEVQVSNAAPLVDNQCNLITGERWQTVLLYWDTATEQSCNFSIIYSSYFLSWEMVWSIKWKKTVKNAHHWHPQITCVAQPTNQNTKMFNLQSHKA